MEYKKGIQLSEAFGAILAVVLIAILVIIAIVLFEALAETGVDQSRIVTNESGAYINSTGYTLADTTACGFDNPSISIIHNASDGAVILAGNYTLSSVGVLTNSTVENFNSVNVSYTYTDKGETCSAADETISQFATYPALVGLVGTIIFLGLVMGILIAAFVFGGRRP